MAEGRTSESDVQSDPNEKESVQENVPEKLTSNYYRTKNIPERFNHPEWFKGYNKGKQSPHPLYQTSNAAYGSKAPSVHTMPTEYYPRGERFTQLYRQFGHFRDHSMNH